MAKESISFPEEFIPQVCRVIRDGLKGKRNAELRAGLMEQVVDLEDYWKRMQEPDKESA